MAIIISKSQLKPRVLELLRRVQESGEELIISDRGKPVLKVSRYTEDREDLLRAFRGSVVAYDRPTEPVDAEAWEALE